MSSLTPSPPPDPAAAVDDDDRDVARQLLQQALARDEVTFEELDDRFAAVYSATTRAELDHVTADLPVPPAPVALARPRAHPAARTSMAVFGDIARGGDMELDGTMSCFSVFGNVVIDLSTATLHDGAGVMVFSVFGNSTVLFPDGVRVDARSFTVFGDQKQKLTPPADGAPTLTAQQWLVFGDSRLYSLSQVPEGRLRKIWKSFRRG